MNRRHFAARRACVAFALCVLGLAGPTPLARAQEPPTYTNVEILSVDAKSRLLVIRNKDGVRQTVELDDRVAGVGDIKAGDKVIVGLRSSAGRARVSSITRATKANPATAGEAPAAGAALVVEKSLPAGTAIFRDRVAALSDEAKRVDSLWSQFRDACSVSVSGGYDDSREWLALWDGAAKMDLSSGFCRDLHNQLVSAGSSVNDGMK